jgi:translation initiation factor 3 subunit I
MYSMFRLSAEIDDGNGNPTPRPPRQPLFADESTVLLTASGDSTARLWDMRSGVELFRFPFHEPARACRFSVGEQLAAVSTDPFMESKSAIRVLRLTADPADQTADEILKLSGPRGRITRLEFTDINRSLISASEDGCVRRWDVETGALLSERKIHDKQISDLQMSVDGTHFITASQDKSAKLVDTETFQVLKTYQSNVPVNSAALSPIFDHVLIGGGQEASQVTTTAGKAGKFEARFFHKLYAEEFANVRGHYGPINAIAFTPDGTGFVSGGEEGYVRMHHFDAGYFTGNT